MPHTYQGELIQLIQERLADAPCAQAPSREDLSGKLKELIAGVAVDFEGPGIYKVSRWF